MKATGGEGEERRICLRLAAEPLPLLERTSLLHEEGDDALTQTTKERWKAGEVEEEEKRLTCLRLVDVLVLLPPTSLLRDANNSVQGPTAICRPRASPVSPTSPHPAPTRRRG